MNERDNKQINSELQFKLKEEDWDEEFKKDLGLESESASQATSTPNELSNSKSMNYLEEVIEEVIQEALEYANAPEEKRVLPALVRKATKVKPKSIQQHNNCGNNVPVAMTNFNAPQSLSQHQQQQQQQQQGIVSTTSINNNNGLLMSANQNPSAASGFHPLVQANLTSAGMQQMLQLAAASGKGGIQIPSNTQSSLQQHVNSTSQHQQQQQQQMPNPMMGFSAAQLPNVIMPTYNTNLASSYTQQVSGGQYQLPVSLSQIQLAQQSLQSQHLLLGNNHNSFSDLSTNAANQQQNLNFVSGIANQNSQLLQQQQQQQSNNPTNFSMSPYQLSGMIQPYGNTAGTQQQGNINDSRNDDDHNHALNLNGGTGSNNPSNNAGNCFQSSSKTNNSNNNNTNNNSALASATANNSSSNNNPNNTNSSSSPIISASTAQSVASLYQAGGNPFDLQQSHLYAQQRLLQQQNQQLSGPGLFPDYAAVMARYGAYH